ncbi:MAG: DASH family cryptochrome, partial [Pedobacter sp.]
MKFKKILVWFRNDLRLHDNEMLVEAIAKSDSILPVYFFDPRYFDSTKFDTIKTGVNRTKFLLESVSALKDQFKSLGGDLLIVMGKPEEQILKIAEENDINEVYHHREVGQEETSVSAAVEDALWKQKINLKHFIGHTLYNKEDLPFPIKDIPDVFAQFKKKTERDAIVKACFDAPDSISFVRPEYWGALPKLSDFGLFAAEAPVSELDILGGEQSGITHLTSILEEGSDIYVKVSGKGVDKSGYSSKLSSWLALGCLSPRKVYWGVKDAEIRFGNNANFSHVILGLLWRDYYRFMFKKHGVQYFQESDFLELVESPDKTKAFLLEQWKGAVTGNAVVDQFMCELNNTGYLKHSSRLLVATYLVHVLKIHWTNGAAYFEDKLIDYSSASNWG